MTSQAADLLIVNGRVFDSTPGASGVAIQGQRIVAVGDQSALRHLIGKQTQVLDARGGLITPGFNDAHWHTMSGVLSRLQVDLSECRSLNEIADAIRPSLGANPRDWIVGRGWKYQIFGGSFPTKQFLDTVAGDRPVFLVCFDGHSAWVSSAALRRAGINASTVDPSGGTIVRESPSNYPSGYLLERAMTMVRNVIPLPPPEQMSQALRIVMREINALGITAIQDADGMGWHDEGLRMYQLADERGELSVRARIAFPLPLGLSEAELGPKLDSLGEPNTLAATGGSVEVGILKAFIDGVVETRTAALLDPYSDDTHSGGLKCEPNMLASAVREADRRGWQIEIHAIGDRGVRACLDAYARLGSADPGADQASPTRRRRHRIEHVELIDETDIGRFGALGVIASMQPVHALPDEDLNAVWRSRVGAERSKRAWLWASILHSGGTLAFGSDWPVVPYDPMHALYVAVTRERPGVGPAGGWLPDQRLSISEAIHAYTFGSAYAEFAEQRRGRVRPSFDADLVVFDRDLTAEDPLGVLEARPRFTIFDGRVVYDASSAH